MFKPLLAADADLTKVKWPALASPKVDGFRCLIHPTLGPVTRSLLPIPNRYVRERLTDDAYRYLDGELVTYTNGVMDDFNAVQSKLSSEDGEPDFHFLTFDSFAEPEAPFSARLARAAAVNTEFVKPLPHNLIETAAAFDAYHGDNLAKGYEGTCLRAPAGVYKFGRSTKREGILLKVKPYDDSEAVIVGFAEQQNHPATLGSMTLRWKRTTFEVGTGFTEAERIDLWVRRHELVGQTVTFRHRGIAGQGRPREPVFVGIRRDLPKAAQRAAGAPAGAAPGRRRSYEPEWTPMQSATFPAGIVGQRADDRGDVYVFVNGQPSYESFDQATARAEAATSPIEPVAGPTIAALERLTKPRTFWQWFARLREAWREAAALNRDIAYFRSQGHDNPIGAAAALRYLDQYYLADFRDFASKRRMAGTPLAESKRVYVTAHLHAKNCTELSGEERAQLKRVIEDMEPEDAFTPEALAAERAEIAEQVRQINEWTTSRPLSPSESAQYAVLTSR